MNTEAFSSIGSAFEASLSSDLVQAKAPAIFAPGADERTGRHYSFISTQRVMDALRDVGFRPVDVSQSRTRKTSPMHARHLVRLRRRYESIALRDAVPEIVMLNSHDGRMAYQLRFGLYRAVCTNGLIVSTGCLGCIRVSHRGNVLEELVRSAVQMAEGFAYLAELVEQMERRQLDESKRLRFAAEALELRHPDAVEARMQPSQLLITNRPEDLGNDVWRTYTYVEEAFMWRERSGRTSGAHFDRSAPHN